MTTTVRTTTPNTLVNEHHDGALAAQAQFEAMFTDHTPKTDVAAAMAALRRL